MSGHSLRGGRRATTYLFSFLAASVAASGLLAATPDGATLGMLDARVNAHANWQHAMAARAGAATAGLQRTRSQASRTVSAASALRRAQPGLEVSLDGLTGAPRSVVNRAGALTAPAPGRSDERIARDYLGANAALFGLDAGDLADLKVLGDSAGGSGGLRMLRMEQQVDGVPVFQSETRFLIERDGRLAKVVGLLVPQARQNALAINASQLLTPQQAVSHLLAAERKQVDPAAIVAGAADAAGRIALSANDEYVAGPITARRVLFPLAPGVLVPAWSLVVFTSGSADWYAVVDAQTGDVLWRKNIRDSFSTHDARFRVYVQADGVTPADSPAPHSPTSVAPGAGTQFPAIAPTIVSMHTAYDPVASPDGWIDDCPGGGCTANETQTLGNNVLACMDITQGANANICDTSAAGVLDGNGRPTGNPDANGRNRDFLGTTPRDFQTNFLPPPQSGNPEAGQTPTGNGNNGTLPIDQFRRGVTTHLFYSLNWYHDKLYELGFDEAAGNFQQTNFSGSGLGGDRVLADVDDGSGTNNANFATPPDGTSGRMQMYRFTGPTVDRDGSLDAEIFMHEATHGVSNRLVGNAAGLNWDPARGMGEGWSDFVALSLLNNTNADDPNGRYASGAYATYKLAAGYLDNYVYGIRRFPYSTDNTVDPLTWADVDDVTNNLSGGIAPDPVGFNNNGGAEVHNIGEIWALTLWEVRSRIIADAAGANGDVPTGNHTTLQLVIDGLKMTPVDPNFTEARDAILDADCATHACANEDSIWDGFADRGLGYGAEAPYTVFGRYVSGHEGIHESFEVPHLDVVDVSADVAIDDSISNNNGAIDPGELVRLSVSLTNPWRSASKAVTAATATLSTSTPGVTIHQNTASYGAIPPQAKVAGSPFLISVAPGATCGSSLDFTLTAVSNLGTTTTHFSLRLGQASGTDPVVTYTGVPSSGLVIPDAKPRGVFHQINVTDDLVIADLDFRIDKVNHPGVGDLDIMLRSPDGIGVDLVSLIDGLNDLGGTSIVNMVIDGDLPRSAANDMVQAVSGNAPYTKSWLPVYNAPWAALVAPTVPSDPVDSLARYDGRSTKGAWTILAADVFSASQGGTSGSGTLGGWSLLVTPVHFACTPFVATVNIGATKTVAGDFAVGGTVTYTVTLTNSGTANQTDNAGDEFTDVLPPELTLVSASATSGTASANTGTNTASWNGSLAPLGGSVTITITATVNPLPGTTTISNQGTVHYDADGNGSNESSLSTDDPNLPGATDPTSFTVTLAPGVLSVDHDSLDFGSVVAGENSAEMQATLSNTGASSLQVTSIAAPTAPFARTGGDCGTPPFALAASANCTLAYTFSPTASGAANATVAVASDAGNLSVALTGNGVAGAPSALTIVAGGTQSAATGATFAIPLTVRVSDAFGNPVSGASVGYTAPGSGASAAIAPASATTNADGIAVATAIANAITGSYAVAAATAGVATPAQFALTNVAAIADLRVHVTDHRDYARYGQILDYLVVVENAGVDAAHGVAVNSLLSPDLDADFTSWICVGPASSGCTAAGSGELADTGVAIPAGSSVAYLISAPVRTTPPDELATTSVTIASADDADTADNVADDTDILVILRDGFDLPYGDGASDFVTRAPLDSEHALRLAMPTGAMRRPVQTLLRALAVDGSGFLVQRTLINGRDAIRLLWTTPTKPERAGAWLPVAPMSVLDFSIVEIDDHWHLQVSGAAVIDILLPATAGSRYSIDADADVVGE